MYDTVHGFMHRRCRTWNQLVHSADEQEHRVRVFFGMSVCLVMARQKHEIEIEIAMKYNTTQPNLYESSFLHFFGWIFGR